ncbi:hypothetical protein CDD83_5531 [Cordyceps sp. RAO-2017]|nr:hypothetical protein CDD83_5531 [Cordyceps sp. RAO-2017]
MRRHLAAGLALERPAEAGGDGPRGSAEVSGGGAAVVVRQQAPRAVDGAGDPRGHGLVDGDGARAALMGAWLVAVAGLSLSFPIAVPLSLLVAAHLFLLLHGTVALFHFALAVVGQSAAAAVEVLAIHDVLGWPRGR